MKYLFGALLGLVLLVGTSHAELIICGDATRLRVVYPSLDPSRLNPLPADCAVVSEANTLSQLALLQSTPQRYLKVTGSPPLVVEMTQGEKDAVDAAIAAQQALQQAFRDELEQQDVCSKANLTELRSLMATRKANRQAALDTAQTNAQAQIDALAAANLTTLKAMGTGLNNSRHNIDSELLDEIYTVVGKLADCLLSYRKAR